MGIIKKILGIREREVEVIEKTEILEREPEGGIIQVLQTWTVSWYGRYGEYHGNRDKKFKVFLSEQDAIEFKEDLTKAKSILQYTENIDIRLSKDNT